jgi:hypothetical protein
MQVARRRFPPVPVTPAARGLHVGEDDRPLGSAGARALLQDVVGGRGDGQVLDSGRPRRQAGSTSSEMSIAGAEWVSAPTAM